MASEDPNTTSSSQPSSQDRSYPLIVEWLGEPVILNYTKGPLPSSPWEIERGKVEARAGVFILEEVDTFGVVARKLREDGLNSPVFLSWGAIQTVQKVPDHDSDDEGEPMLRDT